VNLEALTAEAAKARPSHAARSVWAPLYPAFIKLIENGFTRRDAIAWLSSKGHIPKDKQTKAMYALDQIKKRKTKQP
jgi:hypothetical protein